MVPEWLLFGSVLVLVAFNAALSVYWLRRLGAESTAPRTTVTDAPDADHGDGAVTCRSCGARNDAEYRYCRECVTELPGQLPSVDGMAGPQGRLG